MISNQFQPILTDFEQILADFKSVLITSVLGLTDFEPIPMLEPISSVWNICNSESKISVKSPLGLCIGCESGENSMK